MLRLILFFLTTLPLMAQQQVTPEDFNAEQARIFRRVTEAVSAPCCQNGIPVAYHESGMSIQIRNIITEQIRKGESERNIMDALRDMRFGPKEDMEIIFTVPDSNLLGNLFWWVGAGLLAILIFGLGIMLKQGGQKSVADMDDRELLARYGERIEKELQQG